MSRVTTTYLLNRLSVDGVEKTIEVWIFPLDPGEQQVVAKCGDAHFCERLPDYYPEEFVWNRATNMVNGQRQIDA